MFEIHEDINERSTKAKTGILIKRSSKIRINAVILKLFNLLSQLKSFNKEKLQNIITEFNSDQKKLLREKISSMNPYAFELLINELLKSMGYESITTQKSGDMGIDIVAAVSIGITNFTEVVQVKRQQANIHRPVLDQLRGSLHYQNASRGTIITSGGFSKGCKASATLPGVPPISLIDGEELADLLIRHEIGIRADATDIFSIDDDLFGNLESKVQNNDTNENA
ncbi:restriction endonuclease [Desulfobacterales bacterium HSG2]|nr:restriction endonuclease [Desulfobacterales bacterium HSG2]